MDNEEMMEDRIQELVTEEIRLRADVDRVMGEKLKLEILISGEDPEARVLDYEPAWGIPQLKEENEKVHPRWAKDLLGPLSDEDRWRDNQCGGCRYYIPLEGRHGMDWGACSGEKSPYDRQVVFEHHGCDAFRV